MRNNMNVTNVWIRLALLIACMLAWTYSAIAVEMIFEDFSSTAQLTLNGSTTTTTSDGIVLRLTTAQEWQAGSVFSTQQLNAANFSTFFTFRMTNGGGWENGADGLVFVVQSVSSSIGSSGGGIGYEGIEQSVGIEFDTYNNGGVVDSDGNHVGLNENGDMQSLQVQSVSTDFYDEDVWYVWIDYDGTTLQVRLNTSPIRPADVLMTQVLNIPAILTTSTAYVGFTSATGRGYANHDILSWQYRDNYDPISIEANFTADQTIGEPPLAVQFTDQSSGSPTSWQWDFEKDGTIDSTEQNPGWTYNQPGSYTVSLTVSDGIKVDTETKVDYITVQSSEEPHITQSFPEDNITDFPINSPLGLAFDQNIITGSSGNIRIKKKADNSVVETIPISSENIWIIENTLLIKHAQLEEYTEYYIEIDNHAIQGENGYDFSGISGSGSGMWNFMTGTFSYPNREEKDVLSNQEIINHAEQNGNFSILREYLGNNAFEQTQQKVVFFTDPYLPEIAVLMVYTEKVVKYQVQKANLIYFYSSGNPEIEGEYIIIPGEKALYIDENGVMQDLLYEKSELKKSSYHFDDLVNSNIKNQSLSCSNGVITNCDMCSYCLENCINKANYCLEDAFWDFIGGVILDKLVLEKIFKIFPIIGNIYNAYDLINSMKELSDCMDQRNVGDCFSACYTNQPYCKSCLKDFFTSGDPHLVTFDGLKYDFQAMGEFILWESTENPNDMTIQIRQEPWGTSHHVTVNTAIAMKVMGENVSIYLKQYPHLYINGIPITATGINEFRLINGGKIYTKSNEYYVVWPDYSQMKVRVGGSMIDVYALLPENRKTHIKGIIGNFDTDLTNDFTTRDSNTTFDPDTMTRVQLYHEFGASWRISQAESLFTYFNGEGTEFYTDENFPSEIFMAKDLTAEQRNQAQVACQNAGITDPILLEACILDVGLTGDDTFADGYAEVTPPTQDVEVLNNYLITAAATLGGTISPSDNVVVDEHGSVTFNFTPANQYAFLEDVLVDGVSVGNASSSYAFNVVDADHTITAVFGSTVCNQVTTIPQAECQALVAFGKSTNAWQWSTNTDWLQTTTPCSWQGIVCANGHVTGLLLSGNNLQGSISPEIAALSKLTHLNLANNQLKGNLLPEIGALRELLFLQLSSNQFTGTIPTAWGQLTKLATLSLHSNPLTGIIPREVGQMAALTQLNVFNTGLSGRVPMEVGNLVNLQYLFLHWTNLEGNLPITLRNLAQLQGLYFNHTNLCEPQEQAFQNWLAGIPTVVGTGLLCPFFAEINVRQNTTDILSGTGSYNFGAVNVGSSSAAITFTIENTGTADLTLSGITKGGSHPNDFTVTQPLSSTVNPGGSTTFTMKFTPTATGVRTATISIANNDSDENLYTFSVTGTGQAAAQNFLLWTK